MNLLNQDVRGRPKQLPDGTFRVSFKCGCVWIFTKEFKISHRINYCTPHKIIVIDRKGLVAWNYR